MVIYQSLSLLELAQIRQLWSLLVIKIVLSITLILRVCNTDLDKLTFISGPRIDTISLTLGVTRGNESVTITGSNFVPHGVDPGSMEDSYISIGGSDLFFQLLILCQEEDYVRAGNGTAAQKLFVLPLKDQEPTRTLKFLLEDRLILLTPDFHTMVTRK